MDLLKRRLLRAFLALAFSDVMINIAITYFDFSQQLLSPETLVLVIAGFALTFYAFFSPIDVKAPRRGSIILMSFLSTILFVPFVFVNSSFGTKDLGSIMITVQENEAGRALAVGLDGFGKDVAWHILVILVICCSVYMLLRTLPKFKYIVWSMTLLFLISNPISVMAYRYVVPNPAYSLLVPEVDVQRPIITARPAVKKNLVIIYLESIERTYRDIPETKASFEPLAKIEDRALSFSNIGQIVGTHYTAAGLVASQCGIPLLPKGMFNVKKKLREGVDLDLGFESFLGGIECLGDVLAGDGYTASYMNGSELSIFAKRDLFKTHAYTRLFGRDSLENPSAEPRQNIWGMDDDYIFEKAKLELAYLSQQDKPFLLSMLTIATHGPDAFVDAKCKYPMVANSMIPAAIQCTGDHVQSLIDEVERLGLSDDTMIIVLNDHLAMKNSLSSVRKAYQGDRRNYLAVLGAGRGGKITKAGSALDIYPTILELMGYQLQGHRANMGVSLLSPAEDLAQKLSLEILSDAVDGNTALQKWLWKDPPAVAQSASVIQ